MTVALNANALVTLEDAQVFMKGVTDTDKLTTWINRASDYCEGYCNRPLKERVFSAHRYAAQQSSLLRPIATPINVSSAITCSVDDVAQTVWRSEADGDATLKDVMVGADAPGQSGMTVLYRQMGWWGRSLWPILLSYTGGLNPIPGDLAEACLLVIQTFQRHEKGQTDVQSIGTGVVSGSVSFRLDSLVPLYAKQALDRYRVVPV